MSRNAMALVGVLSVLIVACGSTGPSVSDLPQGDVGSASDVPTSVDPGVLPDLPSGDVPDGPGNVEADIPQIDIASDLDSTMDTAEAVVTVKNVEEASASLESARSFLAAELSEGGSEEDAVASTVTYLEAQAGVSDVTVDESNGAIFFTQEPGIRCGIYLETMINDGADGSGPIQAMRTINLNNQAGSAGKALVLAPLSQTPGFKPTHRDIRDMLQAAGFDVDMYEGTAATPMVVDEFERYDVIYMRAHGHLDGGVFNFMTGMTTDMLGQTPESGTITAMVRSGQLGVGTVKDDPKIYFTVYPTFFSGMNFPDGSLAYLSSCRGLQTTTLSSMLASRGLDAYIGWNNLVESDHEDGFTNRRLFARLLQGASIGAAINELREDDSDIPDNQARFGHTYGVLDGKVYHAAMSFYPPSTAGVVRITLTGCDTEADCPQTPVAQMCVSHQCEEAVCVPDCGVRVCGPDPVCGQSCGTCEDNENCTSEGACVPKVPVCPGAKDCTGRECGLEPVCAESCGTCGEDENCTEAGACVPKVPVCPGAKDCTDRVCGLDPVCGESCGTCVEGTDCVGGACIPPACIPNCGTRICGPDPLCLQSCGECSDDLVCSGIGTCVECAGGTVSMGIVINEVDYDMPGGGDSAEFIELYNASTKTIALGDIELVLVNGTGGGAYRYYPFVLPAVMLAPGDFFVICGNAAKVPNCDLDETPNTDLIQNGGPDAIALVSDTEVLDTVSYEGDTAAPYTEGSGSGLMDSNVIGGVSISRICDGFDTNENNFDFALRSITPGQPNSSR